MAKAVKQAVGAQVPVPGVPVQSKKQPAERQLRSYGRRRLSPFGNVAEIKASGTDSQRIIQLEATVNELVKLLRESGINI